MPTPSSTAALAALLAPLDGDGFFATHWEQRSLLSRGTPDRWPFRFGRDQYFAALPSCSSVRMVYKNAAGLHREASIAPSSARAVADSGASVCAARLENGHHGLRSFLGDLADGFAYPTTFRMNGYLSPGGAGFGLHFDDHSVWILQMEGAKRWRFAAGPAVPSPLSNFIYPTTEDVAFPFPGYAVSRPAPGELQEVVLTPGDVLYLPAGTWHETEAEGYSFSLTLSQQHARVSALVTRALAAALQSTEPGRRFLPAVAEAEAGPGDAYHAALADGVAHLRDVVGRLTPEAVVGLLQGSTLAEAAGPAADMRLRRDAGAALAAPPSGDGR